MIKNNMSLMEALQIVVPDNCTVYNSDGIKIASELDGMVSLNDVLLNSDELVSNNFFVISNDNKEIIESLSDTDKVHPRRAANFLYDERTDVPQFITDLLLARLEYATNWCLEHLRYKGLILYQSSIL